MPQPFALNLQKKEIRLLRLHQGEPNEDVQCSLYLATLGDDSHYEALSYVWGDATLRRPILLDGQVTEVTVNLEAALKRLRYPDRDRHLWVDALCINQGDDVEKTHQVNLMHDIYLNSKEGLLWLGDHEEGPELSPGLQGFTIARAQAVKAFGVIRSLANGDHYGRPDHTGDSAWLTMDQLHAFGELMDLAWWSRIWTFQEAVLPPSTTILCGSLRLPWSTLSTAAFNFMLHNYDACCETNEEAERVLRPYTTRIYSITYQRQTASSQRVIMHVLSQCRHRQATDPRDMLFALLGLIGSDAWLSADYSLDWRQVYQAATKNLIHITRDLTPLLSATEVDRDPILASWATDWRAKTDEERSGMTLTWLGSHSEYNASARMELDLGPCLDSELALKGVVVDEITILGSPLTWDIVWNDADRNELFRQWEGLLGGESGLDMPYPSGGTYAQALHASQRCDIVYSYYSGEHGGTSYRRLSQLDKRSPDDGGEPVGRWYSDFCVNRVLFFTKTGLIGAAPIETRIGDTINVVLGGRMPLFLRVTGKEHRYTYIGQGYVHGIMDGEALQGEYKAEEIILI
jgi:hypothetical protein